MSQENKKYLVEIHDKVCGCILDGDLNHNRKPQGLVEVYELDENNEKQLIGKSNLVVYLGRESILQRSLDYQNSHITPTKDEFICWFGIGDGGSNPSDPFDPIPPTNNDIDLNNEVPISATDTTCADFHDGFYWKHPFDSINYIQDSENDNSWIISVLSIILSPAQAVGEQINEAGLFMAESRAPGYGGPFHLYARVTFPTMVKSGLRSLLFVWYLYF